MGVKGRTTTIKKPKKKRKTKKKGISHDFLVEKGKKWLRGQKGKNWGCPIVFGEMSAAVYEKPDILGFSSHSSTLIECKRSRSDFFRDHKKMFRSIPQKGMGKYRIYMCPTDLIKPEEIPSGWGLVYISEGGRAKLIQEPKSQSCNLNAEHTYMYSIIRRLYNEKPKDIQDFFGRYT